MAKKDEIVLEGLALKAAVKAAESRLTASTVKKQLFADLELDTLMQLDLRSEDPPPAALPVHPPKD